jgi:hypothetical protein
MRIDCALLCDAVTVREGLFHILGGGVTRVYRPVYPSQLGVGIALRIMVHPTEADAAHEMALVLVEEDGREIVRLEIGFQAPPADQRGDIRPGEELNMLLPIGMHAWPLPHEGAFNVHILIDGIHQTEVPFYAAVGGPQELPPPPVKRDKRDQ